MKNTLFICLAQNRFFWFARFLFRNTLFFIQRYIFRIKYNVKEEKTNFLSLRHLFQITQFQLFIAIALAIFIQIVDPYLYPFYNYIGLKIPDDSDYVTFLATVSGIGGIFIGLYYAGISTVGGAIYSRVPNNIRDLLAQERVGNVYMRFLALLTFIGLCFIGLRVVGFPRLYLAVPFVTLLAGIGIIAFVKLGQRAFYLFDPTALSYHIFDQLKHWINMIKVGSFRWNDPAFQVHANKQANLSFDTLDTLADITSKEPHLNGRPFIDLSRHIISFLNHYEKSKKCIPTKSQWYEQRYVHKDWYKTEDSTISIAHQTGTLLQPDIENDMMWAENKVSPILNDCIRINLEFERYAGVMELMTYLDAYLRNLAKGGQLKQCFELINNIGETILTTVSKPVDKPVLHDERLEKLALIEYLATIPINIVLLYVKGITDIKKNQISNKLNNIHWQNSTDIYKNDFRAYCLPCLEWLRPRLNFEIAVENKKISPLWYQTELLLQVEAQQLAENCSVLFSNIADLYRNWIKTADTSKHPWIASAIISREWEYWHKVFNHAEKFKKLWGDISGDRRIYDLPWPEWNIDTLIDEAKKRQNEILKRMSKQSTLLDLISRPKNFPDYAGQFLHTTGESVFNALYNGDLDMIKEIFKPYFYGCLIKYDKLRPKTGTFDWRTEIDFKIAAAPILDLITLSGYAKLFAEFHGNEQLWSVITDIWDDYLNQQHNVPPMNFLHAAISLSEIKLELPHRSVLRTGWHQMIGHKLSVLAREEIYHTGMVISSDTIVIHESPLLRIFARDPYGTFHDGIDIFIAFYLQNRSEADSLDFGWKRRDLLDDIKREEDNYNRYLKSQEKDGE